ncbi:hypothetical protein C5B96_06135 [Subtercola sp. Z020]|uniref:hypothetical protein n=1 Tax=Subtercola sp. Z020 TaxID=2080582 RepID=UPI000CE798AC|nr:hypothetical protein [Subtercola sp. Z020]PPF85640.1 hypothetical protein C5B96_06135 [Subtercola sp. Z020]
MSVHSRDIPGSGDHDPDDHQDAGPPTKFFSGWWLVLAGAGIAILGLALLFGFAAAQVQIDGRGRAQIMLLLLVPTGVALMIAGFVYVVRGKPIPDDSARHAAFRQRNLQLMRQQRDERRARRRSTGTD